MRWTSSIALFGVGVLGSALLTGCDQPEKRQVVKAPTRPPLPAAQIQPPPLMAADIIIAQRRGVEVPAPLPSESPRQLDAGEESSVRQTEPKDAKPPSHRGEEPPQRKSFTDITANSRFGHATDYTWLIGQVEYSRISKGWRLRYASVDEEDPYGGSVTLMEHPLLHGLKDGQLVRVGGRLSNPEGKAVAPPYLVDAIQPIGSQEGAQPPPAGDN